jgi:glycosyltransferase involved in cell wall biosynthesis
VQRSDAAAAEGRQAIVARQIDTAKAAGRCETLAPLSLLAESVRQLQDLAEGQRHRELLRLSLAILKELPPLVEFDAATVREFVSLVRITRQAAVPKYFRNVLCEHEAVIEARNAPSVLRDWAIGSFAAGRADTDKALSRFLGCSSLPSAPGCPQVSPLLEAANIYFASGDYAKARGLFAKVIPLPRHGKAREQAEHVDRVAGFCGTSGSLLVPECLIDVILDELRCSPLPYEPLPQRVMTVSLSFAMGGGERNLARLIGSLARDARVAKVVVAVRSLSSGKDDFFLPQLLQLPLELALYGRAASTTPFSSLAQGLKDRNRLCTAVGLLPSDLQEDIVSLLQIILRERPQALLVRLDNLAGVVAGAMAGVPSIVLYRGEISPDLWHPLDRIHDARFARPRRHVYRRLLERPGFMVANVSNSASAGDIAWLDWPDRSCFARVRVGLDLNNLGAPAGHNKTLRAKLGIGDTAFVVGGVFRLSPEKRPELWISAAALIADRLKDAHFVIVGDGELRDDIRLLAVENGIADRLHMPGAVRDVGSWYRVMDLHMLTSEREGLSNAAIECQHFGVPILAPDVGGLSEAMLPGVTGRLVLKDAGPASFAAEAMRIWSDVAWRESVRTSAPAFVRTEFASAHALEEMIACLGLEDDH